MDYNSGRESALSESYHSHHLHSVYSNMLICFWCTGMFWEGKWSYVQSLKNKWVFFVSIMQAGTFLLYCPFFLSLFSQLTNASGYSHVPPMLLLAVATGHHFPKGNNFYSWDPLDGLGSVPLNLTAKFRSHSTPKQALWWKQRSYFLRNYLAITVSCSLSTELVDKPLVLSKLLIESECSLQNLNLEPGHIAVWIVV